MKFALCFIPILAGSIASAQHVVPTAFAATAGGGTFLGPLSNAQRTYQLLIHSDQLTALVGQNLTGITFRLLPSATANWPAADAAFTAYDIRLSESVAPADRNLTFASNVVGAQTLVRSGPLTFTAGTFPFGGSPTTFGPVIAFSTSYPYPGGHLLVEIRHTGFTGTSASVDSVLATNTTAGYGTQFSACWTGSYTGTSAGQGNFSVIQFTSEGGSGGGCYANCDGSTGTPALTANDFQCFINKYAGGCS